MIIVRYILDEDAEDTEDADEDPFLDEMITPLVMRAGSFSVTTTGS